MGELVVLRTKPEKGVSVTVGVPGDQSKDSPFGRAREFPATFQMPIGQELVVRGVSTDPSYAYSQRYCVLTPAARVKGVVRKIVMAQATRLGVHAPRA
jgi:hypothetical protein